MNPNRFDTKKATHCKSVRGESIKADLSAQTLRSFMIGPVQDAFFCMFSGSKSGVYDMHDL